MFTVMWPPSQCPSFEQYLPRIFDTQPFETCNILEMSQGLNKHSQKLKRLHHQSVFNITWNHPTLPGSTVSKFNYLLPSGIGERSSVHIHPSKLVHTTVACACICICICIGIYICIDICIDICIYICICIYSQQKPPNWIGSNWCGLCMWKIIVLLRWFVFEKLQHVQLIEEKNAKNACLM